MHGIDRMLFFAIRRRQFRPGAESMAGFRRDCEYEGKVRLHLRPLAANACISDHCGMRKTIGGDNDDIDAVGDLDGLMTDRIRGFDSLRPLQSKNPQQSWYFHSFRRRLSSSEHIILYNARTNLSRQVGWTWLRGGRASCPWNLGQQPRLMTARGAFGIKVELIPSF
jgi:hypothetical protein